MKTKKFSKLALNKTTVVNLNKTALNVVKGGTLTGVTGPCWCFTVYCETEDTCTCFTCPKECPQ